MTPSGSQAWPYSGSTGDPTLSAELRPAVPTPSATPTGLPDTATALQWLSASPAALAATDAYGHLSWANPACKTLLGGLPADALGQPVELLLGLGASDIATWRQVLTAGGEAEVQRPPGCAAASWLNLRVSVLPDGHRVLALTGIDELQTARADAQQRAELLDMAGDLGRIGVWERDPHTGEGRWDRHVFRMRGMKGEGGAAPPLAQASAEVHEADRLAFEVAYRESLRSPGNHAFRFRVIGHDGLLRQLESQWRVKHDAHGRVQTVHGLIMDDSEAWALARTYDDLVSQLALAVDLADLVVWRHEFATSRVHWNRQGFDALGIPPRSGGMELTEVQALVYPDDLPLLQASAKEALESGRPTDLELRFRRSDGQYRTLIMRRGLQRDATGQPIAFIGVALDITERQNASRRAAELGRRFDLATRAAGIGYWSLEGREQRATWSDQLRAMHGLPPEAPVPTLDEWLTRWVHPEDSADVRRRFAEWVKSGRVSLETRMRIVRSDGEVRHVVTHSRVESGGPPPLLFGLVIDVSERRSVELALRQAAERAALAARGAGLGTWEVDLRGGTSFWDEQMWRLRGLAPRSQPPDEIERLEIVHPDDRDALQARMRSWQHEDGPLDLEFRVVLPDGRVRWLGSRSTGVRDERGQLVRRIGVNWDVTDTRTAAEVRQEREIAQRESQAKSKFLSRMSHELRTPLNAVLGFSQLLLAEDMAEKPGDDAAAVSRRRRVEHIRSAGEHLLDLINDVLDLSSLEGGEIRISLQPVPLAPLIEETLPLLEALGRDRNIEIVTGELDALPMADATRLRQILINLLTNAIKYNKPGGRVMVQALHRGESVLLRVTDSGRGMSDLQLRHLFEPFNRLGIEREGIEGNGIGLAIVKALVERMGGSVHVDSEPGRGSVFELRLADGSAQTGTGTGAPAHAADSRPNQLAGATRQPRGTLLYVEDNPVNALIISELVARRPDLQLHIAEDGSSGVRKALELRPDLILLDMQLPDFDGHEVLRRLRADEVTAKIPVIALSANAMPEDIDRALRAGMSDYWTKPLDFRAFMASIDALFGPGPTPTLPV